MLAIGGEKWNEELGTECTERAEELRWTAVLYIVIRLQFRRVLEELPIMHIHKDEADTQPRGLATCKEDHVTARYILRFKSAGPGRSYMGLRLSFTSRVWAVWEFISATWVGFGGRYRTRNTYAPQERCSA